MDAIINIFIYLLVASFFYCFLLIISFAKNKKKYKIINFTFTQNPFNTDNTDMKLPTKLIFAVFVCFTIVISCFMLYLWIIVCKEIILIQWIGMGIFSLLIFIAFLFISKETIF
ncbi:MAG: hypothetical protein ABII27_08265 [bacterium]